MAHYESVFVAIFLRVILCLVTGCFSLFWFSLGGCAITPGLLSILESLVYLIALFWKLVIYMFLSGGFLFYVIDL